MTEKTDEDAGKCKYEAIRPNELTFLIECKNNIPFSVNARNLKVCFYCNKPIKLLNMDDYKCVWRVSVVNGLGFSDTYSPYFESDCGDKLTLPCSGKLDNAEVVIKQAEEMFKRISDGKCRCGGQIKFEGKS